MNGEHRCTRCGGLGTREDLAAPHIPASTDTVCPGDPNPDPPTPLSTIFRATP